MPETWTSDRIIALAPDASAAKSGRDLANLRKWVTLGQNEAAIWGECQGSGAKPYQTQIDLSEPAFKCSCPSRKFPCKHSLGLFLLTDAQPAAFKQNATPKWVEEWLASRANRAEKKAKKEESEAAPDPAAQAKRVAERVAKVNAGVLELERWLDDLVRQGFASLQQRPASFWENAAARLIDAQARGAARLVREMSSIPAGGEGWPDRLLDRLGRLNLLLQAYKRIDTLAPDLAADVRTLIGWTQDKESLRDAPAIDDHWAVLGQAVEEDDDRIRIQRNWLWGHQSRKFALVLNFAHASQPLDTSIVPGMVLDASVSYFPSSYPLRAVLKERRGLQAMQPATGHKTIDLALAEFARALAILPWLERFPMALQAVTPEQASGGWVVCDSTSAAISLASAFPSAWDLVSLSGGQPIALFGEWDGRALLPLSARSGDKFYPLGKEIK